MRQIEGDFKVKNEKLKSFHRRAMQLIGRLTSFSIEHVSRDKNKRADKLANIAINKRETKPKGINPILAKSGRE